MSCLHFLYSLYASAIGVAGFETMDITEAERKQLGGIAKAGYGLPGTKKLAENVTSALKTSRVVLMAHHGALILGTDHSDAMKKAEVLEQVCRRTVAKKIGDEALSEIERSVSDFEGIAPFRAQLDDMAQMIGPKFSKDAVSKVSAELGSDDKEALQLLIKKAIISKKYTTALGIDGSLSLFDCILMRTVYKLKYSKQKDK